MLIFSFVPIASWLLRSLQSYQRVWGLIRQNSKSHMIDKCNLKKKRKRKLNMLNPRHYFTLKWKFNDVIKTFRRSYQQQTAKNSWGWTYINLGFKLKLLKIYKLKDQLERKKKMKGPLDISSEIKNIFPR